MKLTLNLNFEIIGDITLPSGKKISEKTVFSTERFMSDLDLMNSQLGVGFKIDVCLDSLMGQLRDDVKTTDLFVGFCKMVERLEKRRDENERDNIGERSLQDIQRESQTSAGDSYRSS